MTAEKFLQEHICLDGKPVHNVVQIQMDATQTTLVYYVAGSCRRAVTVETEAITIE